MRVPSFSLLVFASYDRDGSGTIDEMELTRVFADLGEKLTPDHIKYLLVTNDTNKDGTLDFKEFLILVVKYLKGIEAKGEEGEEVETKEWVEAVRRVSIAAGGDVEVGVAMTERRSSLNALRKITAELSQAKLDVDPNPASPVASDDSLAASASAHRDSNGAPTGSLAAPLLPASSKAIVVSPAETVSLALAGEGAGAQDADDADDDSSNGGEEEIPDDLQALSYTEQQRRIKFRSAWMITFGTALCLLFSDPMVAVLTEIGDRTGISAL